MVSGSEDGAELLSRIGKFYPGPLQACVSLAGLCLSSVLQLPAVQGALGSPSATFSVLKGARASMAGGGQTLAGTPVRYQQGSMGLPFPSDIGPNIPQTTFGFRQADEYDNDHDCCDDCDFDFGFNYDGAEGESSLKLTAGRTN